MLALDTPAWPRQVLGSDPQVLAEVLKDDVNLAVWQRTLYPELSAFADRLGSRPLDLKQSLDVQDERVVLGELLEHAPFDGCALFRADLEWLLEAFACLTGARRIGLRVRSLDCAMCPRFHVDHVPLRLVTTYAGPASQWLEEGTMARTCLGEPTAEPAGSALIRQMAAGDVGLFKGEKWAGNLGRGIVHRSPQPAPGERRLLLTLDWLG
ncbi:DUF1826 domain-containing protein [Pseudomonas sp. LA21]|uniref:DUF1826 domain-containing protein n=1 Tax=unclassified Pseudomonas TaxID=196821 RepID=UPI001FB7AEC7|nr:DUF1826 domain-containing protein [Pseudomonas sp. LA21]MCJ1887582.1 DUF1826 domain-containing protein [Pseudomonas sp. LA21]